MSIECVCVCVNRCEWVLRVRRARCVRMWSSRDRDRGKGAAERGEGTTHLVQIHTRNNFFLPVELHIRSTQSQLVRNMACPRAPCACMHACVGEAAAGSGVCLQFRTMLCLLDLFEQDSFRVRISCPGTARRTVNLVRGAGGTRERHTPDRIEATIKISLRPDVLGLNVFLALNQFGLLVSCSFAHEPMRGC